MRVLAVVVGVLIAFMGLSVVFGMTIDAVPLLVGVVGWGMLLGGIALAVLPWVRARGSTSASRSLTPGEGLALRVLGVVVGFMIAFTGFALVFGMTMDGVDPLLGVVGWSMILGGLALAVLPSVRRRRRPS
ncbi:hypothetical protein [Ornithinimicrobium sp. LYQ103]|uniref:hypothetical protein n=1 Tax=Ornithinimicrobium sp. LYQ103 TaxID=3378796 RepID=UPI0038544896